jgi:hypothetical protein
MRSLSVLAPRIDDDDGVGGGVAGDVGDEGTLADEKQESSYS